MAIDLKKALDKAWEDKPIAEILAAPPSAIAGLTDKVDGPLAQIGINNIGDLARFGRWTDIARELAALGK